VRKIQHPFFFYQTSNSTTSEAEGITRGNRCRFLFDFSRFQRDHKFTINSLCSSFFLGIPISISRRLVLPRISAFRSDWRGSAIPRHRIFFGQDMHVRYECFDLKIVCETVSPYPKMVQRDTAVKGISDARCGPCRRLCFEKKLVIQAAGNYNRH